MLDRLRSFILGTRREARDRRAPRPATLPAPSMLVIGLGNPGPNYAATRHNVGFRVVEALARGHGGEWIDDPGCQARCAHVEVAGRSVVLLEPQTFMNRSGLSVVTALARWPALDPATDLLVVYDEVDLPIGRIRLRPKGGSGGHNGIGDVLDRLGSPEVPRLRFGVGHPGRASEVIDWVLGPFSDAEESEVLPPAIEGATRAIEAVVGEGVSAAMGRFNAEHKRPADRPGQ